MAVSIASQSSGFQVNGDGVATSCRVPIGAFPLANAPKAWAGASVVLNQNGGGNIASAAVVDDMIELTFSTAFSGASGAILLDLTFDLP